MKKLMMLFLLLGGLLSCNRQQKQPEPSASPTVATNSDLHFVFSSELAGPSTPATENWCRMSFPEAAVISPDPVNSNRRLFTLADGPHKITVDFGNIVAAFVLKRKGNVVEIFTSDNFPECLSRRNNFSIDSGGGSFRYDNQKHIQFEIQLVPLPNGTQIALEMAPGTGYGIIVRR